MRRQVFALLLSVGSIAFAQVTVVPGGPIQVPDEGGELPPGVAPPPGATPPGAAPSGPQTRIARLKTLTFDRRPSAILKAWAPPKKADAAPGTPPKDAKQLALDAEMEAFQRSVVVGEWDKVKAYLGTLPDEEATAAYQQILQQMQTNRPPNTDDVDPEMQQRLMMLNPGAQQFAERIAFTADDLFGLAACCPKGVNPKYIQPRTAVFGAAAVSAAAPKGLDDKTHLPAFATVLRTAIQAGTLPEVAVKRFKAEADKPADRAVFSRRQLAKLLALANLAEYAGDFLPGVEQAQKDNDLEGMNLLSRHYVALHTKESKSGGNLEKAWAAVQLSLTLPGGSRDDQEEALLRAVELAPKVEKELGQAWLDESFTKKPDRGMDILATVGGLVSQGLATKPMQVPERVNALKLMSTAVEALLKAAPERAEGWRGTLTLLAAAWAKEAEFSRQFDRSTEPQLRQDMFGNIFFAGMDDDMGGMMRMQNNGLPQPITVGDVLRARPSEAWVKAVDPGFRPKLAGLLARLHLKASEETKAFPMIEQLAPAQPDEAKALVKEFLSVWTKNHDPNANRNRNRYSWFFYGMENRAESIPLTRSKQERNLGELAEWVARIKKLPVKFPDDELVVKAFTACHSSAEVYKTDAIEKVFGPLGTLQPRTLAGLAQQMRANLAGLWREPAEQEKQKTKRKKKDIQEEVLAGYVVAKQTIADGLAKFPDHWALLLAQASLTHDELNYKQELAKAADFTAKRQRAFDTFQKAADEYAKAAAKLPEDERTNLVYEQWFYASLGASDLGMITEDKQPAAKEPARIRAALLALPPQVADRHMDRFANELFTRMSGAKPHLKFRYLKAGFEIVGDHKQAAEAKKVFDYYADLVREIRLQTVVDGSAQVGSGQPFGVFVNLKHTRDIERESGGFGRYLQNQNSGGYFSYNYGRPTADYKDRFEAAARESLKEHFEVMTVTFQDEKVNSRAIPNEFGWRYTPYAYLLLKARGPQVDKIPPLRIDLDFLDTSGYAVLPVESPAVPIDCKGTPEARPLDKLTVTQVLDERQADRKKLLLEIKAVGIGLIPNLEQLATVESAGFEVEKVDDGGVAVKKFEEEQSANGVVSERSWTVTLKGRDGQAELPTAFTFATVRLPTKADDGLIYQRYQDADLVTVPQQVQLDKQYGQTSNLGLYVTAGGCGLGLLLLGGLVLILRSVLRKPAAAAGVIPDDLNAFSVMELLLRARTSPSLTADQRADLDTTIARLEAFFFSSAPTGTAPDLTATARKWGAFLPPL